MKFYVQHEGKELVFPSFHDFQSMYRLKFVSPDDLVRRENSERWVRAGDLPELRAVHLYDRPGGPWNLQLLMLLLLGSLALYVMGQFFLTKSAPLVPPVESPRSPAR